jgi:hypothetical protein
MEARFAHHGMTARVTFVDAATPDDPEVVRITGDAPLPAEDRMAIAVLRSHLRALRRFLDTDAPAALVFEDDVLLHNEFTERLERTVDNLPDDASLVALGYLVWHWVDFRWAGCDKSLENLATLHPSNTWGTHAYRITRAEATKALAALDRPLAELPGGVSAEAITRWSGGYIAHPPLVLEEALDSTVGSTPERLEQHRAAQRMFGAADFTAAERAARTQTIGLCMIVRNESAVIERCIASVRHLIDHWVICDTGSTDGTPEVIAAALDGIPGEIHHREWHDFGHNRSELLRLARGTADYLLLLDADQTLREAGTLPPLVTDVYRLRHTGSTEYDVARLVRGDLPFFYEGRTHEYLSCEQPTQHETLLAWQVVHYADGGSRATKFERDRDLLELTLSERPDDARTVFYLAQTMDALGDRARAIELFDRRATMGGFEEEAWFAMLRAGTLVGEDDPTAGLGRLLACWQRRPARLEPLHDAAVLCERQGWWHLAHAITAAGLDVTRPNDILFVQRWLYDGGLRADHDRACAALGLAAPAARGARSQSQGGTAGLPTLEQLLPSTRFAQVALTPAPPWPAFNPSIAADGDGYAMIVRTANYVLTDGRYEFLDGNGAPTGRRVVHTRNYFVRLGADFVADDVREIHDRSGRTVHPTGIHGLEDCRLVHWRDGWWATATVRDSTAAGMARVLLVRLVEHGDDVHAVDAVELPAPSASQHEKNWVPFTVDGRLRLVYRWHPRRVLEWDGSTLQVVEERPGDALQADWRGSSQGARIDGGWLFAVHEVRAAAAGRQYLHRFVRLGDDGDVRWSPQFTFTGAPVEFAAGLAVHGNEVVVSFGVGDAVAALAVVPLDALLACLRR